MKIMLINESTEGVEQRQMTAQTAEKGGKSARVLFLEILWKGGSL